MIAVLSLTNGFAQVSHDIANRSQNFFKREITAGDCGTDWDAKYGCGKAKIHCEKYVFPVSKFGAILSIGTETICTDGKVIDTQAYYTAQNALSGKPMSLDELVADSLIDQALQKNPEFRKLLGISSPVKSLPSYFESVPEVRNFDYSEYSIASSTNDSIGVTFYLTGDWEERDQKQRFPIQLPKAKLKQNILDPVQSFGDHRAYLLALKAFGQKNYAGSGDQAHTYLARAALSAENLSQYNDAGFFLEQANRATEAIPVLEKVVAFDATRTPAYLNLADAYQKSGDAIKAKANYQKYVDLMEKSGKGAKVPARVRAALKP
jgi:tetratricopeptide (TPR) repeat protein